MADTRDELDRLRTTLLVAGRSDEVRLASGEVLAILDRVSEISERLEGIIENHHLWDGS